VKTAVSIPDPLFEAADQLARRRKVSRSQLYATALELLLAADDDSDITERLNAIYGTSSPVPVEQRAPRRVITVRESW
jgi:metal-responsive CopG/Arc/MetJ family transcriptional regulator